jgi:hypothetical protein
MSNPGQVHLKIRKSFRKTVTQVSVPCKSIHLAEKHIFDPKFTSYSFLLYRKVFWTVLFGSYSQYVDTERYFLLFFESQLYTPDELFYKSEY